MADLDVTDILLDPNIAGQAFTVVRRIEVVDQYGISQTRTANLSAVGSVQPSGDNSLTRGEDYDVQQRGIKVVTAFRLRGPADSNLSGDAYKPDQILWAGDVYEIRDLQDYSAFGGGIMEAECVQVTRVGTPPLLPPPSPLRR